MGRARMSALDVGVIVRELRQRLLGARLLNVYNAERSDKTFIFKFNVANEEDKQVLSARLYIVACTFVSIFLTRLLNIYNAERSDKTLFFKLNVSNEEDKQVARLFVFVWVALVICCFVCLFLFGRLLSHFCHQHNTVVVKEECKIAFDCICRANTSQLLNKACFYTQITVFSCGEWSAVTFNRFCRATGCSAVEFLSYYIFNMSVIII
jgi:hypothetical protein